MSEFAEFYRLVLLYIGYNIVHPIDCDNPTDIDLKNDFTTAPRQVMR
jgi:hypothetical protein